MANVIIVDDQLSSRDFMKYALARSEGRYNLIGELKDADTLEGFLLGCGHKIDLILLDIHTNGKENGLLAAQKIKQNYPKIKVIILTFSVHQSHVENALKIGCEGFWYKDYTEQDLLGVIDLIMAGHTFYPDSVPTITIGYAKSTDFTPQELKVLQAKASGYSNSEICKQLGIKPPTLDTHIRNLKNKTGYDNMLQLVSDVSTKRFIIADRNPNEHN